jgi:hypothetical protein
MGTISTLFGSIVRGSVAGARVFQYIQEKPNIRSEGGLTLSEVRGEVWHANANEPRPRFWVTNVGGLDYTMGVDLSQLLGCCCRG